MSKIDDLRVRVCEANKKLKENNLVILTWGNVSGIDRDSGKVVIKPSGVEYSKLTPDNMVIVDLETGEVLEGDLNPSSDTETHLELYRNFKDIGGIVHTHSPYATAWSQAGRNLPCYGTTHADYFHTDIPCTRDLTEEEIFGDYEKNTGKVIIETFKFYNPLETPAVLVHQHGPFNWGRTPEEAVENATVLEEVSKTAILTENIGNKQPISRILLDKHFLRKHGKDAYYGQD